MTAWIITKDKIADAESEEGTNLNAKGLTGPSTASERDVERLKAGEGKRFRMLDDDGEIYYYGRWLEEDDCTEEYESGMWGQDSEFSPLDNFGAPNAGCTELQYDNGKRDDKGKVVWESL
jgi:hypothetical protein